MEKIDIAIVVLAIALCLVLLGGTVWNEVIETASWGLSFPVEGQPPQCPVSAEKLKQLDAFCLGDPTEKILYLTFDAGYENGCTGRILDALQKHRAPAAFFLVGNYLEQNADLVRRMEAEGHTVGNHTMHHRDMSAVTDPEAFAKELSDLEDLYREITGKELARFYRPPMGIYSEENLKQAQALGYSTIFWSLAYADWDNSAQPDPEKAVEKLCRRVHPGAIVLLHATSETNARILDTLLSRWEEMGYRFAPLSALTAGPEKSFHPLPGTRIAF